MIEADQVAEFEARKRKVYHLFRDEIDQDIWSNFKDIEKIKFISVDDLLSVNIVGDIRQTDWFNESFKQRLVDELLPLKFMSLDEEYGSWISCELLLDHDNDTYIFLFNFDEYLPYMEKFTAINLRHELDLFPRAETGIPNWWKSKMSSLHIEDDGSQ